MSVLAPPPARVRDSLIGRLDGRARLLATVAFALVVVSADSFTVLGLGLALALLLAVAARLPGRATARRVLAMDAFIVVMLVLFPFTMAGEPLFSVGPFTASREGAEKAAAIALKANAVVLCLLALVGSMEGPALGRALQRLHAPDKLVHLFLFTVRYIDVLHRESQRLRTAMKARCFTPRTDRHTWRSLGYLIGMLLVRSFDRSERILAAMKCRGFDGRFHSLHEPAATARDGVFLAAGLAVLGGLAWLDMAGTLP